MGAHTDPKPQQRTIVALLWTAGVLGFAAFLGVLLDAAT